MTGTHPLDTLAEVIAALDPPEDSAECLLSSFEFVGAVQYELFAKQEEPRKFACLKHGTFAILSANDECYLETGPLAVQPLPKCVIEYERLPGIEPEPNGPS